MIIQFLSAIIILGIALLYLNPGELTMPESLNSMLIVALIIAFLAFAGVILKEKSRDEREALHAQSAGRLSYLVGVGLLIVALVFQAIMHEIDPWIILVLCGMVFTKLASRIYSNYKK